MKLRLYRLGLWLITKSGFGRDYVEVAKLIEDAEVRAQVAELKRHSITLKHTELVKSCRQVDGLLSVEQYQPAQAILRAAIISNTKDGLIAKY